MTGKIKPLRNNSPPPEVSTLLFLKGLIFPVVSKTLTGSIPLVVDYYSSRVSSSQSSVKHSLGRYLWWWTIIPHPVSVLLTTGKMKPLRNNSPPTEVST
jgi:nitrate reductase NapE component